MRKLLLLFFAFGVLANIQTASAQVPTDGEGWLGVVTSKKLKKDLRLGMAAQVRTSQLGTNVKSYFGEVNLNYRWNKYVKFKLNYRFSRRPRVEANANYRHRYNGEVTFRYRDKPFTFSLRNRFQLEYDNLYQPENRNLETWVYRFRPMADYKISKRNSVGLGFEGYQALNNPDGNRIETTRFIAGYSRDLKRKREIVVTYIWERNINQRNPSQAHILRIKYFFAL